MMVRWDVLPPKGLRIKFRLLTMQFYLLYLFMHGLDPGTLVSSNHPKTSLENGRQLKIVNDIVLDMFLACSSRL